MSAIWLVMYDGFSEMKCKSHNGIIEQHRHHDDHHNHLTADRAGFA
jgi:hypothetical protein